MQMKHTCFKLFILLGENKSPLFLATFTSLLGFDPLTTGGGGNAEKPSGSKDQKLKEAANEVKVWFYFS